MRIIVDAMGGDNAPESAVWGGALAAKEYGEEVLLVGKPEIVANVLKEKGLSDVKGITIMPANDLVDMHDDPATVLRRKPDSSMAVAFKLLKAGEGDALVSAGNTGALLTGATLYGGRIKGIRRGALAPVMPCANGQVMLCDAGANTECTAEMLLQFAFLASLYAEKINGVVKPRVGLVNNGTEDTKGDPLRKEAYALLKKAGDEGRLNFVGNVEGSMVRVQNPVRPRGPRAPDSCGPAPAEYAPPDAAVRLRNAFRSPRPSVSGAHRPQIPTWCGRADPWPTACGTPCRHTAT